MPPRPAPRLSLERLDVLRALAIAPDDTGASLSQIGHHMAAAGRPSTPGAIRRMANKLSKAPGDGSAALVDAVEDLRGHYRISPAGRAALAEHDRVYHATDAGGDGPERPAAVTGGEDERPPEPSRAVAVRDLPDDVVARLPRELVRVLPEYGGLVANAAGDASRLVYDLSEGDSVTGRYFIDAREIQGLPEDEGFVVPIYGVSMIPDFHPGDRVVCRKYFGGWAGLVDGHYLIRVGAVAYVKGLQRLPKKRVRVVSANADRFPPYEIDLTAPDDALDVEILAVVYGHFKRYWE